MARTNKFLAMAALGVTVLAGCGSNSSPSDAGVHDGGTHDAGNPDAGSSDGGTPDAGLPPTTSSAVLDSATAHVIGRRGRDVRITLTAHDPNKAIAAVMVRLLDASGTELDGFDSHQSGALDSSTGPATFDSVVFGSQNVNATASLPSLELRIPSIASIGVSLRDIAGGASNEIVASLGTQTALNSGDACDTSYVDSRCPDTLYCATGPSPTCTAAPPPQVTQLAFLTNDAGSILRVKGTELGDDLGNLHIAFLDGGGGSISIPLDGENSSPVDSFDFATSIDDSHNGAFFMAIQPAQDFAQLCTQISTIPSDITGAVGAAAMAKSTPVPVRGLGVACDLQGFDLCAANTVCAPSTNSAVNTCAQLASTQSAACKAAPVLTPTGNALTTFAHTGKTSLWNAPSGCSSNNPVNKPVGLAQLHLSAAAPSITLTTDNPGTDFDTILYVLPNCAATSAGALGCDDDTAVGVTSTLTLKNLAAGNYTVVIGAFDQAGGNYQLTVSMP